ncbi:MAG: very short patch repair endonuclease [Akkermansia muciniphila]
MDSLTPEQRSHNMAAVKSKNTQPELALRKLLFAQGYRFRIQRKDLPGTPDIVLPKYRTVIFVNGCFWHRHENCRYATTPSSNVTFWKKKFEANVKRDTVNYEKLKTLGWNVLIIWGCEMKKIIETGVIPGFFHSQYIKKRVDE